MGGATSFRGSPTHHHSQYNSTRPNAKEQFDLTNQRATLERRKTASMEGNHPSPYA